MGSSRSAEFCRLPRRRIITSLPAEPIRPRHLHGHGGIRQVEIHTLDTPAVPRDRTHPSWGSSWGFFGGFRLHGPLLHWWRGVGWDGRIPCRVLVLLGFGFDLGRGGAAVGAFWAKGGAILSRSGCHGCRVLDAVKRLFPSQTRDKTALHPMEVVNADFHRFDVFVRWPLEAGQEKPVVGRPQMVAFQDIYSGRILAWRVDQTPNAQAVKLVTGDMIEDWGIPEQIVLDNGREFAAKVLTGGTPTRYRFKVREDDLPGLFVSLGCQVHWATPYSGQSKPIERAFRDMCDAIAKDPRFDGAYTGNSPDAKPEDYGSRAIDLEEFLRVLGEGIEEHNNRQGRRSEVAWGRSFAQVFDEAYANTPIRKATEEQRRLWLLGAEGVTANSQTGQVRFMGNEYFADWMHSVAGKRVIVRFDPANLWDGLHVYSADNRYLGHADCLLKAGFLDVAAAKAQSKARKTWLRAEKDALKAHRRMKAVEIGVELDAAAPPPAAAVEARVVRPVFDQRPTVDSTLHEGPEVTQAQTAIIADLVARRRPVVPEEQERERFRRAKELEASIEQGEPATAEQQRWLSVYQTQPEYKAHARIFEDFGWQMFG
jgi:putative transposase